MPLETVGSVEALLQLMATYEGLNGKRANPAKIWREIVTYINGGGKFRFYPLSQYNPDQPAEEFLADVAELVESGLLIPLKDGTLEVTPVGHCLAFSKTVPSSLLALEAQITRLAHSG
jgi:hypothetical protein